MRAHFNVMAWSDDAEELRHIKNDVVSQLASMECMPRHNTIDCPTLYWAAIPGNAADFPAEESFYTFTEQAVCLFTEETNYRSSLSPLASPSSFAPQDSPSELGLSVRLVVGSASRWWTGSRASPCTSTSATCP